MQSPFSVYIFNTILAYLKKERESLTSKIKTFKVKKTSLLKKLFFPFLEIIIDNNPFCIGHFISPINGSCLNSRVWVKVWNTLTTRIKNDLGPCWEFRYQHQGTLKVRPCSICTDGPPPIGVSVVISGCESIIRNKMHCMYPCTSFYQHLLSIHTAVLLFMYHLTTKSLTESVTLVELLMCCSPVSRVQDAVPAKECLHTNHFLQQSGKERDGGEDGVFIQHGCGLDLKV